jgi:hypothetical protein
VVSAIIVVFEHVPPKGYTTPLDRCLFPDWAGEFFLNLQIDIHIERFAGVFAVKSSILWQCLTMAAVVVLHTVARGRLSCLARG